MCVSHCLVISKQFTLPNTVHCSVFERKKNQQTVSCQYLCHFERNITSYFSLYSCLISLFTYQIIRADPIISFFYIYRESPEIESFKKLLKNKTHQNYCEPFSQIKVKIPKKREIS